LPDLQAAEKGEDRFVVPATTPEWGRPGFLEAEIATHADFDPDLQWGYPNRMDPKKLGEVCNGNLPFLDS